MTTKTPDKAPTQTDKAIPGGVTNEVTPEGDDKDAVRRREDLTIRGADPKELSPPRQMSEHLGRKTK